MKDYYDILGVGKNATLQEIRLQYKKLALEYQPTAKDDSQAHNRLKEVVEAYEILRNPLRKKNTIYL